MPDPCGGMFCPNGQFCDPATVSCQSNRCLATQCGAGQTCVSTHGTHGGPTSACETDPCITINCPSDCWTCGVTTDGIGTCMLKDSCQPVTTKVGQHGGGESGCSCAVGGGRGSGGWLWMGLVLGLGLVVGRRRRRVEPRSGARQLARPARGRYPPPP